MQLCDIKLLTKTSSIDYIYGSYYAVDFCLTVIYDKVIFNLVDSTCNTCIVNHAMGKLRIQAIVKQLPFITYSYCPVEWKNKSSTCIMYEITDFSVIKFIMDDFQIL